MSSRIDFDLATQTIYPVLFIEPRGPNAIPSDRFKVIRAQGAPSQSELYNSLGTPNSREISSLPEVLSNVPRHSIYDFIPSLLGELSGLDDMKVPSKPERTNLAQGRRRRVILQPAPTTNTATRPPSSVPPIYTAAQPPPVPPRNTTARPPPAPPGIPLVPLRTTNPPGNAGNAGTSQPPNSIVNLVQNQQLLGQGSGSQSPSNVVGAAQQQQVAPVQGSVDDLINFLQQQPSAPVPVAQQPPAPVPGPPSAQGPLFPSFAQQPQLQDLELD